MRLTRTLLACGVVGPLLFSAAVLIQGATRPGYSAWRNAGSQLALGDQGWMQTINFFACGLLLLCFAIGLRRALPAGRGSTWTPRLVAGIGLCLVLAGIFPVNPGLGYPPGVPATYSLHGAIHFVVGTLLFGQLSAVCFVLARRFASDPGWKAWAPGSIAIGAIVALFYLATVVVSFIDQAGSGPAAWHGLLQRISLFSGLAWLSLVALRLWALAGPKIGRIPDDPVGAVD
jgi:hypothetical membrane protein